VENDELETHAWPWAISLAGSILVLSIALKVIGIDFSPVMQAITLSYARDIERVGIDDYDALVKRIKALEKDSHPPTKANDN